MIQLYPWQKPSAEKLLGALRKYRSAADLSETGCGKTAVAAWVASELKLPTYVICPLAVIPAWKRWLPEATVVNYEKVRTGKYGIVKKSGKSFESILPAKALIIYDEAHVCKGMQSTNAKVMVATYSSFNLILSATLAQSPLDLKAIGYVLRMHRLNNFWSWARNHGCRPGFFGGLEFTKDEQKAREIMAELFRSVQDRMSRIAIADLGDAFVENLVSHEAYEFEGNEQICALYALMETHLATLNEKFESKRAVRQAAAEEAEEEEDFEGAAKILSAEAAINTQRERQQIEMLKLPLMLEKALEFYEAGNSVSVFVNFKQSAAWLVEQLLPYQPAIITGEQNGEEKEEARQRFQENKTKFAVLTVDAGGVGITLSDLGGGNPRVSLISPTWNARQMRQVLGRIHRADSKSLCRQYVFYAAGTIEERVCERARSLGQQLESFNTGTSRGPLAEVHSPDGSAPKDCVGGTEVHASNPTVHGERPSCDSESCGRVSSPNTVSRENVMIKETSAERPHAEFSPSSLKSREACPGYDSRGGTNPIAESGTRCHDAVESGDDTKLDETEAHLVQICRNFLSTLKGHLSSGTRTFQEIRVDMHDQFGYIDLFYLTPENQGHLVDYKFGFNAVDDAEVNIQGWAYAVGLFEKFPAMTRCTIHFVMPRLDSVSSHTFTREVDFERMKLRVVAIIERAKAAKAGQVQDRNPGTHCEYCKYAGVCTALSNKALVIATKYDNLPMPTEFHGSQITTPEDMGRAWAIAKILEPWIDSIKKHAVEMRMMQGIDIPGLDLKERQGRKTITSAAAAYELLKDKVTVDDFIACTDLSWTKLSEAVGSKAPRGQKGKWQLETENILLENGIMEVGKPIFYLQKTKIK